MQYYDLQNKEKRFELPNTDKIIISFINEDFGIDLIYKIIDDITEYLTAEIGLDTLDGFSILYDENNGVPDRYKEFF